MKNFKIIAAVRTEDAFIEACKSDVEIIFDLAPSIENLGSKVLLCRKNKKLLFAHIDLSEGIGKDKSGLKYIKGLGVDGIISTKPALIKYANETGLRTVQRVFILDSQSLQASLEIEKTKSDMIELMPGILPSRIINNVCSKVGLPVILGGLIETEDEVRAAIDAGASAVSTGKSQLWNF